MRRMQVPRVVILGFSLAFIAGEALHVFHAADARAEGLPGPIHWLRDSLLAVPVGIVAVAAAIPVALGAARWLGVGRDSRSTIVVWAFVAAAVYAVLAVPGHAIHDGLLAEAAHHFTMREGLRDAASVLLPAFAGLLVVVTGLGAPWVARSTTAPGDRVRQGGTGSSAAREHAVSNSP